MVIRGRAKGKVRRAAKKVGQAAKRAVAAVTGRICHAIEIDPAYVDVAVRRWQDFTGETGKLQILGQSFGEIVSRARSVA